jgi:hypothetical protein
MHCILTRTVRYDLELDKKLAEETTTLVEEYDVRENII